jgi:hypothetical protein
VITLLFNEGVLKKNSWEIMNTLLNPEEQFELFLALESNAVLADGLRPLSSMTLEDSFDLSVPDLNSVDNACTYARSNYEFIRSHIAAGNKLHVFLDNAEQALDDLSGQYFSLCEGMRASASSEELMRHVDILTYHVENIDSQRKTVQEKLMNYLHLNN